MPQNTVSLIQLNSHHRSTCPTTTALETSPPAPLAVICATQAPSIPATWSIALTSTLSAHASWAPLSIVAVRRPAMSPQCARHSVWCPVLARHPATVRGPPLSTIPARQYMLGLWALGPAEAAPWALDPEAATHWAVDPVASDTWVIESGALLPWAMDPDSATQPILIFGLSVDLASKDPFIECPDLFAEWQLFYSHKKQPSSWSPKTGCSLTLQPPNLTYRLGLVECKTK